MDEEEFNKIITEKQKLILKNRENSKKRVFLQEDSQATESVAETSSISSVRTSKRVAKLKAENDADIDTDPMATPLMSIKLSRKKGKGKMVEQQTPEEIDQIQDTFSSRPKRKIKRFKLFEDDDDIFNKDLFDESVSLMSTKGKKRKHNMDDNEVQENKSNVRI
jgi:hypothetical protein